MSSPDRWFLFSHRLIFRLIWKPMELLLRKSSYRVSEDSHPKKNAWFSLQVNSCKVILSANIRRMYAKAKEAAGLSGSYSLLPLCFPLRPSRISMRNLPWGPLFRASPWLDWETHPGSVTNFLYWYPIYALPHQNLKTFELQHGLCHLRHPSLLRYALSNQCYS